MSKVEYTPPSEYSEAIHRVMLKTNVSMPHKMSERCMEDPYTVVKVLTHALDRSISKMDTMQKQINQLQERVAFIADTGKIELQ